MSDARIRARNRMHRHLMRRILERDLSIDYGDVHRFEAACERLRPCFETPDCTRYKIRVNYKAARFVVIYDTIFDVILTVWAA